jgi:hypothetical protein
MIHEAFVEEVLLTYKKTNNGTKYDTMVNEIKSQIISKQYSNLPNTLPKIKISVSYDMGWSKRGCGKVYNSLSGHAFIIGCRSGKALRCGVLQKQCSTCNSYRKRDLPIPNHPCNINHDGSSGSMETLLCKDLIEEICEETIGRVMVGQVVSDDDSTLRSVCSSHSKGGKLYDGVDEPEFLADPAHRTKVMAKPIFALVKKTRKQDEVKKVDALRLKKYISCYINQYWNGDFDYFVSNAMAPVEHLFDNHAFCDNS